MEAFELNISYWDDRNICTVLLFKYYSVKTQSLHAHLVFSCHISVPLTTSNSFSLKYY